MTDAKENCSANILCTLTPVAIFRSPLSGKFGIPRQAGLAEGLRGQIVLQPPFRHPDALRGLDGFDYLWLIWGFSLNRQSQLLSEAGTTQGVGVDCQPESAEEPRAKRSAAIPLEGAQGVGVDCQPESAKEPRAKRSAAIPLEGAQGVGVDCQPIRLTVRPPRLGGNDRVGVFASRSPFRPNSLGLSSIRIESVDFENGIINVLGADLADGTPIYDIKPYVTYTDSHSGARSGFVDDHGWEKLEVIIPGWLAEELGPELTEGLSEILSEDPRPQYQKQRSGKEKTYGMTFAGRNIQFKVNDRILEVIAELG